MNQPRENPQLSTEISKYAVLHESGVVLSDDGIDFVIDHVEKGVNHLMEYIGQTVILTSSHP